MYLYSLGVRITPRGVDELPLAAIEVKSNKVNSNNKTRLPVETTGSQDLGRDYSSDWCSKNKRKSRRKVAVGHKN